jgi:PhoD-like phosphatase
MRPGAWSLALEINLSCTMALFWDIRAPSRSPGSQIRAAVPELVLGPLLRYVGPTDATVWLETDSPCKVEASVGNFSYHSPTFRVGDHHYALVRITNLEPGSSFEYEVTLDDTKVWPAAGSSFPPSLIRTLGDGEAVKLVFGSCRISAPHEPPYSLSHERDKRGLGVDALYAMAMRLRKESAEELPHALVLLGDQVYAHKPPQGTLEFIRSRRDTSKPPGEEVADFEEYTRLYWDSWKDPAIRWLLSTVPSAMIFDDHEVSDDWNISESWLEDTRTHPWWNAQIIGAHTSYWVYQHLGNLSPEEIAASKLFEKVRNSEDAWPLLREFAYRVHRTPRGTRWSFHRDFGNVRLIMMDSRGGRVLEEGNRSMVDDEEWAWIEDKATGHFDHLLLGTSLPVLLGPGMQHLQAWNEVVCAGVWGERAKRWGERLRRSQDLDHWASFHGSFVALTGLIQRVAAGERGNAPASITILSGDVHHGYLAEARFRDDSVQSPVYQAVCSPLRNALPGRKSRLQDIAWTKIGELAGSLLSRLAGVEAPEMDWRLTHSEPWFENHVATLELDGPHAKITFEEAIQNNCGEPDLQRIYERNLS